MPSFKPIHTKYHKLQGAKLLLDIGGRAALASHQRALLDLDYINNMLGVVERLPRYVIYEDLIDMLHDRDGSMQKSLTTMIEHDLGHLPFPEVLVEFDEPAEITSYDRVMRKLKVRHFIWLTEREDKEEPFTAVPWTYIEEDHTICLSPLAASAKMVTEEGARKISEETGLLVTGEGSGAVFRAVIGPQIKAGILTKDQASRMIDIALGHAMAPATKALCALIVLLSTRGIEKELIEIDPRLNRSRKASGKGAITDHTVIRIGHTYNKKGERVKYGTGRYTYPVYWVSGHVRGVRYGPGKTKLYEKFIHPYLVNYRDGDEIPKPKTKEVML